MARKARIDEDVERFSTQLFVRQRERIRGHFPKGMSEAEALRKIVDYFFAIVDKGQGKKEV